jgi:hypothetical protein
VGAGSQPRTPIHVAGRTARGARSPHACNVPRRRPHLDGDTGRGRPDAARKPPVDAGRVHPAASPASERAMAPTSTGGARSGCGALAPCRVCRTPDARHTRPHPNTPGPVVVRFSLSGAPSARRNKEPAMTLTQHKLRRVGVVTGCDPRSVARRLAGRPHSSTNGARIDDERARITISDPPVVHAVNQLRVNHEPSAHAIAVDVPARDLPPCRRARGSEEVRR